MKWTFALALVLVALCVVSAPAEAASAAKRPQMDLRAWLRRVYPGLGIPDEELESVGDKRNRDEDYGHLRFGRAAALGDDYGHMRFGRK